MPTVRYQGQWNPLPGSPLAPAFKEGWQTTDAKPTYKFQKVANDFDASQLRLVQPPAFKEGWQTTDASSRYVFIRVVSSVFTEQFAQPLPLNPLDSFSLDAHPTYKFQKLTSDYVPVSFPPLAPIAPLDLFSLDVHPTYKFQKLIADTDVFAATLAVSPIHQCAGVVIDDASVGAVAWANPGNAAGQPDGVAATAALSTGSATSHYLNAQSYGFNIPSNATIIGFVVKVRCSAPPNIGVQASNVRLIKAGAIGSTNRATATVWPTSLGDVSYGGAGDLFGTTWTPADVNNAGFGCAVSAHTTVSGSGTASVDAICIDVYFTFPVFGWDSLDVYPVYKYTRSVEQPSLLFPISVALVQAPQGWWPTDAHPVYTFRKLTNDYIPVSFPPLAPIQPLDTFSYDVHPFYRFQKLSSDYIPVSFPPLAPIKPLDLFSYDVHPTYRFQKVTSDFVPVSFPPLAPISPLDLFSYDVHPTYKFQRLTSDYVPVSFPPLAPIQPLDSFSLDSHPAYKSQRLTNDYIPVSFPPLAPIAPLDSFSYDVHPAYRFQKVGSDFIPVIVVVPVVQVPDFSSYDAHPVYKSQKLTSDYNPVSFPPLAPAFREGWLALDSHPTYKFQRLTSDYVPVSFPPLAPPFREGWWQSDVYPVYKSQSIYYPTNIQFSPLPPPVQSPQGWLVYDVHPVYRFQSVVSNWEPYKVPPLSPTSPLDVFTGDVHPVYRFRSIIESSPLLFQPMPTPVTLQGWITVDAKPVYKFKSVADPSQLLLLTPSVVVWGWEPTQRMLPPKPVAYPQQDLTVFVPRIAPVFIDTVSITTPLRVGYTVAKLPPRPVELILPLTRVTFAEGWWQSDVYPVYKFQKIISASPDPMSLFAGVVTIHTPVKLFQLIAYNPGLQQAAAYNPGLEQLTSYNPGLKQAASDGG
jgi:hypothetical protein